jgi:hypothetical protein
MLWYDTAANILKMRSEADDAWINVGYFDQGANAFRILDDTQVTNTSGTQTGLLGDQTTATWEAGTGTTESLVSPAKVKAAVLALSPPTDVGAATAALATFAVGSYIFALRESGDGVRVVGSNYAGSTLKKRETTMPDVSTGIVVSMGASGTWKYLGALEPDGNVTGLFVRVA